jgi:hypothetical protein
LVAAVASKNHRLGYQAFEPPNAVRVTFQQTPPSASFALSLLEWFVSAPYQRKERLGYNHQKLKQCLVAAVSSKNHRLGYQAWEQSDAVRQRGTFQQAPPTFSFVLSLFEWVTFDPYSPKARLGYHKEFEQWLVAAVSSKIHRLGSQTLKPPNAVRRKRVTFQQSLTLASFAGSLLEWSVFAH